MSTLLTNITELVTNDHACVSGSPLGLVQDAALVIEDGRVAWVGRAGSAPDADERVDLGGRAVVPGFVDSHTHLVFAGDRSAEFSARMAGERYTGGGIATTVAATRAATDEELRALARARVQEMRASGTTTFEAKSGYGLSVRDEVRILRISGEFTDETTFLGAHAIPAEFANDRTGYVGLVTGEMLRACAPLARWIDVFCDERAFSEDEARDVLAAGVAAGLMPRIHGNQLGFGPGARLAVEVGAASVDHCTHLTDEDVATLAGSDTVATLLPWADLGTRSPFANGRRLIDAGVTVALATDCNPGTSFVTSMPLMIALAVSGMGMTPAEALFAATAGGAKALRRHDVGSLSVGARADLVVLDAPSYVHLAYRPGTPLVSRVWSAGVPVAPLVGNGRR